MEKNIILLHRPRTQVLVVRKSGNLGGGNLPVIITSALPLVGEGEIWVVEIYQSSSLVHYRGRNLGVEIYQSSSLVH